MSRPSRCGDCGGDLHTRLWAIEEVEFCLALCKCGLHIERTKASVPHGAGGPCPVCDLLDGLEPGDVSHTHMEAVDVPLSA